MNAADTLRRVNPRRPAQITPQGLRRIVLGSSEGSALAAWAPAEPTAAKPLRSDGPFTCCTLVVVHADRGTLDEHAQQVIATAAILAPADTEVVLAVLGACHDDAAALGADRVLVLADLDPAAWRPQGKLLWLDELVRRFVPETILLPDREADGDLGRRYAVAAGRDIACGVVELGRNALRVRAGSRLDAQRTLAPVMLLAPGVADTRLPFVGRGCSEPAPGLPRLSQPGVQDLGVEAGDPQRLALEEADLILAAGNGVQDLPLFHALAQALGAAVGASRVAVDKGDFARHQQVGATGKTVRASAYLALGISGAVQHLQGIKACRHVIAVNLDATAPIVRRAQLSVVADTGAWMRALLALVQDHRRENPR